MSEEEKKHHNQHAPEGQGESDKHEQPQAEETPESNFPEAEEKQLQEEHDKKVKDLEAKLAEAEDKRLRCYAEMENLRKRTAKEMENLRLNVLQDTISPFLQVFDHFAMAVSASEKSDNLKSLLQGMKMIENEFDKAFSELGVTKIDAVGQDFDPNLHEAVSQEASDTVPQGKVIRQWSCGYKTPLRLLKPAMVVVSSGPEQK